MTVSGDDRSLLMSKFAARPRRGEGQDRSSRSSEENTAAGEGAAAAIDYDAFVRWLSEGGGLDDALLGKVQRHLKARLSK